MKPVLHSSRINAELCRIRDKTGEITVTQRGDKRILSFGSGLEQSSVLMSKPYHLSHEYTQIMLLGLVFVEAKHITILGLGGGGLVHCLHHYYPQIKIQAIELRQAVIDIAKKWFEMPCSENIKIKCIDAIEYIQCADKNCTDLILSDLYEAKGMSKVQAQNNYIESCYKALSEHGWLVMNFHYLPGDDSEVMIKIQQLFSEIKLCDVFKGNWVMFCGKDSGSFDKADLKDRAKTLAKKVEMPMMYYFKQLSNVVG